MSSGESEESTEAYQLGLDAFDPRNPDKSKNPYPPDSEEYDLWSAGYTDAHSYYLDGNSA